MKRNLSLWQFSGFATTSFLGTVLHFWYDWSHRNPAVALVSGVNESTWEHMKLLYVPLLVFALIQSRFFGAYDRFWCVKLAGITTGLVLIPVLYYTYNGAVGPSPDWLNITIFFLAAGVTFLLETRLFKADRLPCNRPWLAFALICLIGVLFAVFTFVTPTLPLFRDPLTGTYGIGG